MAVVERKNILNDLQSRQDYIEGVLALKQEVPPGRQISTYDRIVLWHYRAMMTMTPEDPALNPDGRNAAHTGPVFLPWHRMFLNRLEQEIQRVLGKPDFGLPYWDWGGDGDTADPGASLLWADDCLGPAGFPIQSGPFREDNYRVHISDNIFQGGPTVRLLDRGLRRALRQDVLPTTQQVLAELTKTTYDLAPWGFLTDTSFRCSLEVTLHNTVHIWVGGDMVTACSPNDPVFFLHHGNVDRIWASWQKQHGFPLYVPGENESEDLLWHRITDTMFPLAASDPPVTPEDVLLFEERFIYDKYETLPVPEPEPEPLPIPEPLPGPEPQPLPPG